MEIKPIETLYNGYRFRSRLEARWAVFFDAAGIKYEYEPEGFEVDGVRYLPDFYLPEAKRWIEIKGKKLSKEELEKCSLFCESQDKEGIKFTIFMGQPSDGLIGLKPSGNKVWFTADPAEAVLFCISGYSYEWKTYDLEYPSESGKIREHVDDDPALFLNPDLCEEEMLTRFRPMLWFDAGVSKEKLIRAAMLARQARFEHGEKPRGGK